MELPEDIISGLAIANDKKLGLAPYKAFVDLTFDIVCQLKTEQVFYDHSEKFGLSITSLKVLYAALNAVILEAAKLNFDPIALSDFLKQQQWDEERIELFTAKYTKMLGLLRLQLSSTTFGFPHIIDTDWRYDFALKSDSIARINTPQFTIRLKVKENGEMKTVEFGCDLESLQDLVDKLADATQSVQRLNLS